MWMGAKLYIKSWELFDGQRKKNISQLVSSFVEGGYPVVEGRSFLNFIYRRRK